MTGTSSIPPHPRCALLLIGPLLLGLLPACLDPLPPGGRKGPTEAGSADTGTTLEEPDPGASLRGFIGSPCERDEDCDYEGGRCLREGFPGGTCSAPCTQYCPDQDGHPTTFCAAGEDLPAAAAALGDGACLSRCDTALFPIGEGCREGYGCVVQPRANEPETQTYVCLPGRESQLSDCQRELIARGVGFEPTIQAPDSPDGEPDLVCEVQEAVRLISPMLGVELRYADGSETSRVLGACTLGHALADTIEGLAADGVQTLYHYGTYNCRVISGSSTLSRHAYGDAIDITGFGFRDGAVWTLVDHWEHDTSEPSTEAGAWLYQTAWGWHEDRIWSIILTPNYNAAHDDHFHVDLTPGSDYIGMVGLPWFGPNPSGD